MNGLFVPVICFGVFRYEVYEWKLIQTKDISFLKFKSFGNSSMKKGFCIMPQKHRCVPARKAHSHHGLHLWLTFQWKAFQ